MLSRLLLFSLSCRTGKPKTTDRSSDGQLYTADKQNPPEGGFYYGFVFLGGGGGGGRQGLGGGPESNPLLGFCAVFFAILTAYLCRQP
jgi:hypothetical protein